VDLRANPLMSDLTRGPPQKDESACASVKKYFSGFTTECRYEREPRTSACAPNGHEEVGRKRWTREQLLLALAPANTDRYETA